MKVPGKNSIVIVAILDPTSINILKYEKKQRNSRNHTRIVFLRLLRNHSRQIRNLQIRLRIILTSNTEHKSNDQLRPLPKTCHPSPSQVVPFLQELKTLNSILDVFDARVGEFVAGVEQKIQAF